MCVPLPKAQRLPFAARQHDRTDEACHIRTHLALIGMVGVLGMAGVDAVELRMLAHDDENCEISSAGAFLSSLRGK
eukprot:COSAG01_NODE_45509_length_408_cov_18.770227_2_plen_76_part_01